MLNTLIIQIISVRTGEVLGKITKKWGGVIKEYFTDADTFQVEFAQYLDVYTKATLLAALFLIVSSLVFTGS